MSQAGNGHDRVVRALKDINTHNKRSKNFDKRPNRRQKMLRRSQDRGKVVDNWLSVGKVVHAVLIVRKERQQCIARVCLTRLNEHR